MPGRRVRTRRFFLVEQVLWRFSTLNDDWTDPLMNSFLEGYMAVGVQKPRILRAETRVCGYVLRWWTKDVTLSLESRLVLSETRFFLSNAEILSLNVRAGQSWLDVTGNFAGSLVPLFYMVEGEAVLVHSRSWKVTESANVWILPNSWGGYSITLEPLLKK